MCAVSVTISRRDFDATIFDLDGVLTDTAGLHATAWKAVFDALLKKHAEQHGLLFVPFDITADYLTYVDGRPRADGIRSFVTARGIKLAEGSQHDPEDADTVYALGQRKTRLFLQALDRGIEPEPGAQALLKKLRSARIKTAIGSSSKNTLAILRAARIEHQFDAYVDGNDAQRLGLAGKPDPAPFLEVASRLKVAPSRAILFEDALPGVEAGKRGRFGLVVGIDRGQQSAALTQHGANIVITSLREVDVEGD